MVKEQVVKITRAGPFDQSHTNFLCSFCPLSLARANKYKVKFSESHHYQEGFRYRKQSRDLRPEGKVHWVRNLRDKCPCSIDQGRKTFWVRETRKDLCSPCVALFPNLEAPDSSLPICMLEDLEFEHSCQGPGVRGVRSLPRTRKRGLSSGFIDV